MKIGGGYPWGASLYAGVGGPVDLHFSASYSDGYYPDTDYLITSALFNFKKLGVIVAGKFKSFGANGFYAPYESYEQTGTAAAVVS